MSNESLRTAGILLVVYPTVVFGGASLLWHWITRRTAYYDHPLRRSMWRAGHAHAGVLLLLSLVAIVLVDADSADGWKQVVRTTIPRPPALPIAFFLSIVRPDAERPTRLVNLAYLGAITLTVGTVTLGVGLPASGLTMRSHHQASPCAANRAGGALDPTEHHHSRARDGSIAGHGTAVGPVISVRAERRTCLANTPLT